MQKEVVLCRIYMYEQAVDRLHDSAPAKPVLRGTGLHSRPMTSFTAALPDLSVATPVTTSSLRLYRLSKTCIMLKVSFMY